MKLKINLSVEFEPQKDYYEEGTTLEEMLAIETNNAKDNPAVFLTLFSFGDIEVTGEIVEGGDS